MADAAPEAATGAEKKKREHRTYVWSEKATALVKDLFQYCIN